MSELPPYDATTPRRRLVLAVVIIVVAAIVVAGCGALVIWWIGAESGSAPPVPVSPRCVVSTGDGNAQLAIDQAENAAIIAGVAIGRDLAPRAVSIALTTALQESGLRNLDYGDRDSLGLFQQRPSMGWGTEEQVMDPYYSSGKFYDVMVTVPNWDTADIGDVAQAVQRSGFPDAYDKHISRARLLATALSGQTPAAWSCVSPTSDPPDPASLDNAIAQAYGATITASLVPASDSAPATLTLSATSTSAAWSAAAFAQSWASSTGVSSVQVGSQIWQASTTVLPSWTDASQSPVGPTHVVVTF